MNLMTTVRNPAFLILVLSGFLSGCAVSTDKTVVTAPAVSTGDVDTSINRTVDLPSTIAVLPFTNRTDSQFAFEVVRRTIVNHLSTRNYRMLHWRDVDSRLSLAGIDTPEAVASRSPEELRKLLGVDGLIYGEITHYDKTFAGIYARITVGVALRFLNANDEVIWQVSDVRRSRAGGLSTSPVGLILNALVAANHLRGDLNLYRTADDLGRALAGEIPEPPGLARLEKPVILDVVHSGAGQVLRYGDVLEIGLEGSPGMRAAASIEGMGLVDLREEEPGQYIGSIAIDKGLNLSGVVVSGSLQDEQGQTSRWISPYGLLFIDNTPPGPVTGLTAQSRDAAIRLQWQSPPDTDVARYRVSWANTETDRASDSLDTSIPAATISGLRNFQKVYIRVVAIDRAGNTGAPSGVQGIAAPDPRFGNARPLSSDLPTVISGISTLTLDGSPYYLRSPSRIATDGVLLIAPGVQILVSPQGKLSVLGELHSFGNTEHPVLVTGDHGQGFDEFLILQTARPVTLNGLKVVNAGIPVQVMAGKPLIEDCSFVDSMFNALVISGSSRPVVRRSLISGAKASGVVVSGQAQPVFQQNWFIQNEPFHLQNGSSYQLDLRGNTFDPEASGATILGNVIYQEE